jgi:hypothetical protein
MATMEVLARTFTAAGAVCSSTSVSRRSGIVLPSPLALKSTFKSQVLRNSSRRNDRRSLRSDPLVVRATSSEDGAADPSKQFEEFISDLKTRWAAVDNKTNVAIYAGGALVTLWFSSTIIGAVNSVPLLPKLFELIGLGYTGWFVYRYLLFKESRKQLVIDVEELKGKITGATNSLQGTDE